MQSIDNGRTIFQESFGKVEIIIPYKKNWFTILFLIVWLGIWVSAELAAVAWVINGERDLTLVFSLCWLAGWTIGGLSAIRTLVWMGIGKEIITLEQGVITIRRKGLLLAKAKAYYLNEAKHFQVLHPDTEPDNKLGRLQNPFEAYNAGMIRFDYGMETVKFAENIHEAEAEYILAKLKDKKLLTDKNFTYEY
ncbi:hypothetical protein QNI19_21540 [Cytophagaceae bacterium DM2B3-1]|uniref:DUF304 domain-containing protein n=1 Tax=Xanthocytophaga flava TaxID=3048013 RepID=A0ABT7CPA5_9BACT|nr:hypothetical protein [Xanthocytophaga flavus]MDJ1466334.1 hypothetical protein [Xanthocytophaga flavus]MDJ1495537.1 hypothetical protein [Xanthocytophaga flavus]